VKVGLVDTGVDPSTPEFTLGQFTAGESGTRELTFGNDQTAPACSHGTRMAGIIAAGKNGHSVVGVAWASHFYTYRTATQLPLIRTRSLMEFVPLETGAQESSRWHSEP
jgi:subtilisin family serine protease